MASPHNIYTCGGGGECEPGGKKEHPLSQDITAPTSEPTLGYEQGQAQDLVSSLGTPQDKC